MITSNWSKPAVAWPPLLVTIVISFCYAVFMTQHLVPQLQSATAVVAPTADSLQHATATEAWIQLIAFHLLFVMVVICFLRSMLVHPGGIPKTEYWRHGNFHIPDDKEAELMRLLNDTSVDSQQLESKRAFLQSFSVIERKLKNKASKNGTRRFCSQCDIYKPDRCHHCRICNQCVLRMDHHCPWIANCVGFHNYKHFLLFLLYGWMCAAFVLVFMLGRLIHAFRPVVDTNSFLRSDLFVIIAYLFCAFLFLALFGFFMFHMNLVLSCLTTIEYREKKGSDADGIRHRWAVSHTKYDRGGMYGNFLHVFGSPWMWLLPVQSDLAQTDGTYSETLESTNSCA